MNRMVAHIDDIIATERVRSVKEAAISVGVGLLATAEGAVWGHFLTWVRYSLHSFLFQG